MSAVGPSQGEKAPVGGSDVHAVTSVGATSSAIELNAKPSKDFAEKLTATIALLQHAAADYAPVTQASSLGAEDVVITHLINRLNLNIPVFVLNTGVLHAETEALMAQTVATSKAPVTVHEPVQEAVIQFVTREGKDAMYKSIELRKACCGIRKMEPLSRALAGQKSLDHGSAP